MTRILALAALAFTASAETVRVEKTDRVGRIVQNEHFVADLSKRVLQEKEEDSGSIRALTYKPFGVTFYRSGNPRMHWAPNMQRPGAPGYKGIGTWHPVQTFREEQKGGAYKHYREGHLADYPEMKIEAEYTFLDGEPYFLFWSRMTVDKPFTAVLLRNNEMTMDSFFTHVAWPGGDGARHVETFEDRKPLLEKERIAFEAPWVAFLNLDKGYGYGFVKLELSAAKTRDPGIGISDGANNGKYWSRSIIRGGETALAAGDRFEERSAYVLFKTSKDKPLQEFFDLEKKIRTKHGTAPKR